jgi:hypothetical protein
MLGPPSHFPVPSLHAALTSGPPTPCLSSQPRHRATIKGVGDAYHYSREPKPLSPRWNHAKASSSSPPLASFAFCMPLSLLLHRGWCLTFLSLHPPMVQDSVTSLSATESPPPPSNATVPCYPPLHRHVVAPQFRVSPRLTSLPGGWSSL